MEGMGLFKRSGRTRIDNAIYSHECIGISKADAQQKYIDIVEELEARV